MSVRFSIYIYLSVRLSIFIYVCVSLSIYLYLSSSQHLHLTVFISFYTSSCTFCHLSFLLLSHPSPTCLPSFPYTCHPPTQPNLTLTTASPSHHLHPVLHRHPYTSYHLTPLPLLSHPPTRHPPTPISHLAPHPSPLSTAVNSTNSRRHHISRPAPAPLSPGHP